MSDRTHTTLMNVVQELIPQVRDLSRRVRILELNAKEKPPPWYPADRAIIDLMEVAGCSWEDAHLKLKEQHEEETDGV